MKKKTSFIQTFLSDLFRYKGYLFKKLLPSIITVSILTAIACFVHKTFFPNDFKGSLSVPGLLGAALGMLLVFRNNTAYERWWEARKVLGGLVNTSRNFALQINTFVEDITTKEIFAQLISSFAIALKEHLRNGVKMEELDLPEEIKKQVSESKHRPNTIAKSMNLHIKDLFKKGCISDFQMIKLIDNVDKLIDILGKSERIKNTPMPASHSYLLKLYIMIYVLILPFNFAGTMGYWTILVVPLIYFIVMSLVLIAEEIEEPYGTDTNDLDTQGIANNIGNNVREILD